jgi:hypothetical protein
MAHEKNVGKHHGLGTTHKGSFAKHSRKTVHNTQGTAMAGAKKSRGAKIR